eukprot:5584755-Amphidinium_carterae.1
MCIRDRLQAHLGITGCSMDKRWVMSVVEKHVDDSVRWKLICGLGPSAVEEGAYSRELSFTDRCAVASLFVLSSHLHNGGRWLSLQT